jgi:hypothetical protein
MIDTPAIDRAAVLFPNLPSGSAPASAPVAPAAVAPAPAPQAAAPVAAEETAEARLERLFGFHEKPAAPAPQAPAAPTETEIANAPTFDAAHPDTSVVEPVIRELGITHQQATRLEALHAQMTEAASERQSATWAAEAQRLPPDVLADARAAVNQFGGAELKAVLNKTGLGNNSAVITAFARALRSNPYRR